MLNCVKPNCRNPNPRVPDKGRSIRWCRKVLDLVIYCANRGDILHKHSCHPLRRASMDPRVTLSPPHTHTHSSLPYLSETYPLPLP